MANTPAKRKSRAAAIRKWAPQFKVSPGAAYAITRLAADFGDRPTLMLALFSRRYSPHKLYDLMYGKPARRRRVPADIQPSLRDAAD